MLGRNRSFERAKQRAATNPGRRRFVMLLWAGFLLCALPAAASAQSQARLLDAPRAAGIVGERYDGYAVVRGAAPPDVVAQVSSVNAERRTVYAQRAAAQGAPVEAVGKIYAAEIMKSAPKGTWFLSESGQWAQKQ
jgi:uncharacterized protein YdbL (DUF1318 family)